jgi:hypothetical protein
MALCLPGSASGQVRVARDWRAHPAVVQIPKAPKDLYCVSDLHGDYKRFAHLLRKAHLIGKKPARPEDVQWRGGKAVLVVVGDAIDRWPRSLKTLRFLRALDQAARAVGGRVIVTMGNHEQDFLATPRSEMHASFLRELAKAGVQPEEVVAGRDRLGLGAWLRDLPVAARVGDWFFVHAGDTGGRTIPQIEQTVRQQVSARGFSAPILAGRDSMLNARLDETPWWSRPAPGARPDAAIDRIADQLGVKHVVIGHVPGKVTFPDQQVRRPGELFHHFGPGGGQLWLIDSGLSRGMSNTGELLHVKRGTTPRAWRIDQTGRERPE